MVVDPAAATSDPKPKEETAGCSEQDLEQDYAQNLANGKKNLLCGDFPEAVACFQAACSLQSERFGDTSNECAEAFFYYGRALLELARVENGVLGNALKGVPETEDSDSEDEENQFEKAKDLPAEEREKLRQDVEAAMATENEDEDTQGEEEDEGAKKEDKMDGLAKALREATDRFLSSGHFEKPGPSTARTLFDIAEESKSGEKSKPKEESKSEEKPEAKEAKSEEKPEVKEAKSGEKSEPKEESKENEAAASTSSGSVEASTSSGVKSKDGAKEENLEDPDDIPNMQLAWEMLELAKVLFTKKPKNEENSLMVAQCHLKLGELGLEIENYSQAIGDFLESLVVHKEVLPKHDRRLAETHYSLGLAYSFDKRYDNALEHYNSALAVLESRIDHLNEQIDENDRKHEKEKETMEECAEIGEIKDLIPDINSKIEDVMAMKRQEGKMVGSPFRQAGETSTGFAASNQNPSPVCTVIPIRKGSSSSGTAPDATGQSTNDISHLVRRKRATPDDERSKVPTENGSTNKKLKQEPETNGSNGTNEAAEQTNGVNGENKDSEKVKDVSVKKTAAELKEANKEATGAAEVAMET